MSYLLGVDVGSTNLKAVLFDTSGRQVAKRETPTELCRPDPAHPEWAVWRPEQIWGGVAQSIRGALAATEAGSDAFAATGKVITSFASSSTIVTCAVIEMRSLWSGLSTSNKPL